MGQFHPDPWRDEDYWPEKGASMSQEEQEKLPDNTQSPPAGRPEGGSTEPQPQTPPAEQTGAPATEKTEES